MSEETDTKWLCHRCVKKEGATVDADPVLLRVCDGCQVENYVRLSRGVVVFAEDIRKELEAETVVEEVEVEQPTSEEAVEIIDAANVTKQAEIEALKAQIAELEK